MHKINSNWAAFSLSERSSKEPYKIQDFYTLAEGSRNEEVILGKKPGFLSFGAWQVCIRQITYLMLMRHFLTDGFKIPFLGEPTL